jgi:hypothetical protein
VFSLLRLEVGDDREDASVIVGLVGEVELDEDVANMALHGARTEDQPVDDPWLERPSAMSWRTSISRSLSCTSAWLRRLRPTNKDATSGSMMVPPAATRRADATNASTWVTRCLRR